MKNGSCTKCDKTITPELDKLRSGFPPGYVFELIASKDLKSILEAVNEAVPSDEECAEIISEIRKRAEWLQITERIPGTSSKIDSGDYVIYDEFADGCTIGIVRVFDMENITLEHIFSIDTEYDVTSMRVSQIASCDIVSRSRDDLRIVKSTKDVMLSKALVEIDAYIDEGIRETWKRLADYRKLQKLYRLPKKAKQPKGIKK